jgi:prepilin-type N-terminal cleavage/methylation domain-containing protein
MRTLHAATYQRGLTLTELTLTLVIVAGGFAYAATAYSQAEARRAALELASALVVLADNVRQTYRYASALPARYEALSADSDNDGNASDGDVLVKHGIAPATLRRGQGGRNLSLAGPSGEPVLIRPAQTQGNSADGFEVEVRLDGRFCAEFVVAVEGTFDEIRVRSRTVKRRGELADRSALVTACAGSQDLTTILLTTS